MKWEISKSSNEQSSFTFHLVSNCVSNFIAPLSFLVAANKMPYVTM